MQSAVTGKLSRRAAANSAAEVVASYSPEIVFAGLAAWLLLNCQKRIEARVNASDRNHCNKAIAHLQLLQFTDI